MDKFDIPEPKKIAPQLTAEQRRVMQPIDLLVQYIMPKLWDKVNYLEWTVKAELHSARESLEELQSYADRISADTGGDIIHIGERVTELERAFANLSKKDCRAAQEVPKKRSRKKAASASSPLESEPRPTGADVDISEPVVMTNIARYDPQTDQWVPKVIDGVEITASVVDMIAAGASSYSIEVASFVYDLSENERKVLCATFPDEETTD